MRALLDPCLWRGHPTWGPLPIRAPEGPCGHVLPLPGEGSCVGVSLLHWPPDSPTKQPCDSNPELSLSRNSTWAPAPWRALSFARAGLPEGTCSSWCAEIQSVLGSQPLCDPLVSLGLESSRHSAGSSSAHGRPTPQGHGLRPQGLRLFLWDSAPEVDRAGLRVTSPCTLDTGAGPALPASPAVTGLSGQSLSVSGESPGSVWSED